MKAKLILEEGRHSVALVPETKFEQQILLSIQEREMTSVYLTKDTYDRDTVKNITLYFYDKDDKDDDAEVTNDRARR